MTTWAGASSASTSYTAADDVSYYVVQGYDIDDGGYYVLGANDWDAASTASGTWAAASQGTSAWATVSSVSTTWSAA